VSSVETESRVHRGREVGRPTHRVDRPRALPAGSSPLADRRGGSSRAHRGAAVAKRALDLAFAGIALVLLLPVFAVIAVVILLQDGAPVLFRQQRVGKDGSAFTIAESRTMHVDAEERLAELMHRNEGSGPLFRLRDDPRVTRAGRLLRKTSLDELPQLWNARVDDMSLVGPRPALPREVAQWDPVAFGRLTVRPDITGP